MPCEELTKAAGWKSDQSCDPPHIFRARAPAPLENFAHTPKKSFATQSEAKRTLCRASQTVAPDPDRTKRTLIDGRQSSEF